MALVYTNTSGNSFGVSSGPSNQMAQQTPAKAFRAILRSIDNAPSGFGTLVSDPKNNRAFRKRHPEDFYTQNEDGDAYPHVTALTGKDLSAQWRTIVTFYAGINRYRLTYSPITQNSNTVAGMALRRLGMPIPFSSATYFAPGAFTRLPRETEVSRETEGEARDP